MKRFLLILLCIGTFLFSSNPIYAQTPVSTASSDWVKDDSVTFLGRGVNRAQGFMDWTLTNYKWNSDDGPLTESWKPIRNIVYTMSILAVLVTGFLIVIKGNQSTGVFVFIKEFIIALLLVTFSYALARLFFQIADIFQLFFFQAAGTGSGREFFIGKDIINISIPEDFIGYKRNDIIYNEPAFISLLLVQLSSITFYVIGCILTVRKIILWFFLISAPLYPLLLIYKPIKNTGKIWIQELLRWLLYGPLFALFLAAIVIIWRSSLSTLPFSSSSSAVNPYPTSISILLGGPGQSLSLANSLNYNDTFIQYVVALLMLWIAILMPFILLQVMLGFLAKHEFEVNPISGFINNIRNGVPNNFSFLKKSPPPISPLAGPHSGGLARELPKYKTVLEETNIKNQTFNDVSHKISNQNLANNKSDSQVNQNIKNSQQTGFQTSNFSDQKNQANQQTSNTSQTNQNAKNYQQTSSQTNNTSQTNQNAKNYQQTSQFTNQSTTKTQLKPDILSKSTTRLINFAIPNMSDIVKFETARLSHNKNNTSELQKTEESLKKIANPKVSSNPVEEDKFISLQEELNQETAKGDVLAESILSAAIVVRKPSDAKKGETQAPVDLSELPTINLPTVNQIQTVSFDDYEAVKDLWLENYQQSDIPEQSSSRKSWIEDDIQTVSQAITLLSSSDSTKVNEGLSSVSDILPFFLIGGFSQTEIIAYLKAKSTAAKLALIELAKKEENQNTLLKKTAQKTSSQQLTKEAEIVKEEVKR